MRFRLAGVLILLIALWLDAAGAAAQSAQTDLTDRGQIQTFREVSEALVCQCGCNMILYVCNHQNCPSAIPFRAEIERQIRDGKRKDEIVADFVAKNGQVVLSAPPAEGFDLAAWVAPFVALVLGGVFVLSFLGARRRARAGAGAAGAAAAGTTPATPAPRDAYAARVDAEIDEIAD
jgi:cytochrome c-type biogenesis protein CcmH